MADGITQKGNEVTMGTSAATGAAAGTAIAPGVGTIIGAGLGLLGGALSNISNKDRADESYDRQKEALQNSVRWRVADAKAAGIHPLYALGQAPMNIAPMAFEDKLGPALADAGQGLSSTISRMETPHQKAMAFMDYEVAASVRDKNDAEALYFRTMANKNMQAGQTGIAPGLGIQPEDGQMPNPPGQGMINLKPAEQLSMKKGHEESSAGINPAYQLRYMDQGLPMYLPIAEGDSPEETISEMSFPTWAGLLMRNARIFGPGWMQDMIKSRYLGEKPKGHYNTKETGRR